MTEQAKSCGLATPGCHVWTVRVTSVVDGVDHAVTDADMCAGIAAGLGVFRAVCGVVVTSDALAAPPGRLCPGCWATLHPPVSRRVVGVPLARRGHRRPGRLRRWAASVSIRSGAAGVPAISGKAARGWVR